jgi:hypothetical protein
MRNNISRNASQTCLIMTELLPQKSKTKIFISKFFAALTIFTFFIVSTSQATNYYYDGTGNISSTANWWTVANGTGSNPASFALNNNVFNIINASTATMTATWTVSGTNSKIVVGDGVTATNFTVPAGFALTVPNGIDVASGSTLTITNLTVPVIGTLAAACTVVYNGAGNQAVSAEAYNNLTISGTGTKTAAGNMSASGVLTVNCTLAMTTRLLTAVGSTAGTAAGVLTTTNTTTTLLPAGVDWLFEVQYNATTAQTVVGGTYDGDLTIGTGNKTVTGDIDMGTAGKLNITGTLAMGTNALTGTIPTTTGAGTLSTASTDPAPIPAGITWIFNVTYTAATQNVVGGTYKNDLTLSAASGTKTVVGGDLTVTTGNTFGLGANTLDMGTNALSVAASPTGVNAIIKTASTATVPITASITWIPEIDYTGTGQNVVAGTYSGDLVITGTGTAKGIIAMGTTGNLTVNGTLDMSTFTLTGTLPTITGTGLLQTANVTTLPIPTGKMWPFEIEYNGAAQTVVTGTYNGDLTISGTNVKAAAGTIAMGTAKLNINSTLNMGTQLLTGTTTGSPTMTTGGTGSGLLQTGNTSAAPIPTTRTWNFDVEYNGGAIAIMTGTYNGNLLFNGTSTAVVKGSSTVNGNCTVNSGVFAIASGTTVTLTVVGDFIENGGYVDLNNGSGGAGTIALKGNLTQNASFMGTGGAASNGLLDFIGGGVSPQIMTVKPTTSNSTTALINPGTGLQYVDVAIESGASVQLNSNVQLNTNVTAPGVFTVKTGGTLNMQANIINANTAGTRADFILQTGATLITSNAAGINSTGATGAIQTTANITSRSFSSGANYEFDAATGATGVFTTTTNPQVNNLTIKSTGTVTASQAFTVNGALDITGTFDLTTFALAGGGSFSTSGSGVLKTANTSAIPLPADKTWSFPITYNSAGVQTIMPGTYNGALTMSSVGVKTFAAGTINVAGNWLTSGGLTDLTTNAVNLNFTGASAQAITDNTAGTVLKTVNFSGGGTKTMSGAGKFSVSSSGTLTMAGATQLAAGGLLWLKSDATGSAMVATIPAGASITGDVFAERFMYGGNSNTRRGYRLLSSTTHDASTATYNVFNLKQNLFITGSPDATQDPNDASNFDTSPNHGPTIYHYNETITGVQNTGDFIPITLPLTNDEFKVGEGMYVFYRGLRTLTDLSGNGRFVTTVKPEDNTLVYKGTLNQGTYTVPLSYTSSSVMADGYNLLGNPYPATIDISTSLTYTGSVDPFIYEVDPTTKAFCTINKNSVTTKTGNASQFIASGQGFFVKATATGASVTFNESGKVTQQLSQLSTPRLLMSTSPMAATQVPQVLKLKMVNPADSSAADDIAIAFDNAGKVTYDGTEDAFDFGGNGTVALSSFSSDNVKLAINTYPAITNTTKIKLGAVSLLTGSFNMVASNLASLDSKYQAKLIDNYKADTIQLSANSTYAFDVNRTIPATYADGRFEVVFSETPITINPVLSFTGVNIKKRNDLTWKVNANPLPVKFTLEKSTNNINFSVLTTIVSDSRDTYTFSDDQPVKGDNYYRLGQTDVNNHLKYADTINVKYKDGDDDGDTNGKPFKIYPQPVVNNLNIALNQDGDDYKGDVKIKIMDLSGQVIKKANFNGLTYSMDLSKVRLGLYVIELSNDKHVIGQTIFIKL